MKIGRYLSDYFNRDILIFTDLDTGEDKRKLMFRGVIKGFHWQTNDDILQINNAQMCSFNRVSNLFTKSEIALLF